jgi:hypothetical protein
MTATAKDLTTMSKKVYKVTLYHGGERPNQVKFAYSLPDAEFLLSFAEHVEIEEISYD